ncbi:hypothetical protein JRO89_XS13G0014100 [Xanthoceras sorbifolium]|uniref:Bifunctional inhibitor/plant lipid transfer protein/seed storage helical domain-containing protein n=1 Tax=Xanthoceras sorbifolium TaxID=99658 RepID=A0ABQ8H5Z9_9ROSI|nr:hypothetical protein JRO89_XS13G0014100 [Xanthoceras sorbifolium]
MASLHSLPFIANTSLIILLLTSFPQTAFSQDPITPGPTLTDCVSRLLPLSPCTPYVQGTVQSPTEMCCVNLKRVYGQQPACLCLLLNGTSLSNMPINTTLALQLPVLCDLQADVSACPACALTLLFNLRFYGFIEGVAAPPGSNSSDHQVSLGTHNNSIVAASPMVVPVAPRPSRIMGFGLGQSTGIKCTTEGGLAIVAAMTGILFTIY